MVGGSHGEVAVAEVCDVKVEPLRFSSSAERAKAPACNVWCEESFICKVSLLFRALYTKCPYYFVLYMQSVLILYCFICKVCILFRALYAKCPYYFVHYMQSVLMIQ